MKLQKDNEKLLAELERQKEYFQLAVDGTNMGTWDWYVQTGEVKVNERWAEIIGYTLEELEPITIQTWETYAHPDDLAKSEELLKKHWVGETDQYISEARMKHKDGHWVWVLDQGKVFEWTEDGKPKRMTGTHLDITERKEREEELQKLNKLMQGRELKMVELKKRIKELEGEAEE
jgi:PAS domain S-box-containing protein